MPGQEKYRVTTWPGRLPHPPVSRRRYQFTSDERAVVPAADESVEIAEDSAGEIYLRLREVDLDEPGAILSFVNAFGPLGVRAGDFSAVDVGAARTARQPVGGKTRLEEVKAELANVAELHPLKAGLIDIWRAYEPPRAETLAEFRFAAEWIHDLTNLWIVANPESPRSQRTELIPEPPTKVTGGRLTAEAVERAERNARRWRILDPETDPYQAQMKLDGLLRPALQPFHPRLMIRSAKTRAGVPITSEAAASFDFMNVPVIAICALELFNHIVDGQPYKRCANETCGRLFVRQSGRAEHGQHRTKGVRYCSKTCLSAQKQRDHRARRPVPRRNPGASKRP